MSKWRIVACIAMLIAATSAMSLYLPSYNRFTPVDRASLNAAMARPRSELMESCRRGGEIECRALLRTRPMFDELALSIPILCALMLVGWLVFIRKRAQAPFLLPYASIGARAVSVVTEASTFILILSLVTEALPEAWRVYSSVPSLLLINGYTIAAHALFGQNFGKFVAGIKIVRADGAPIGWREAAIRSAVDAVIGGASVCIQIATIAHLNLDATPAHARSTLVFEEMPIAWSVLNSISTAWVLSEVAVALLNRHRRALHDYLAGTVVIDRGKR